MVDFSATKVRGQSLWDMGDGRWIGVDRSATGDTHVECEIQCNSDGTITVLDVREYPPTNDKSEELK